MFQGCKVSEFQLQGLALTPAHDDFATLRTLKPRLLLDFRYQIRLLYIPELNLDF